jgi:hypothetical protein
MYPGRRLVGFIGLRQDAPGAFQVTLAGIGGSDEACRPGQDLDAEVSFQRRNGSRNGGRRHVQAACRRGKTFLFGYCDENAHRMQSVHFIIPLVAIINCTQWIFF